ncbi:MAG: restriction endonuclease subunit S [Clostridia bacterium]|nr:restriction endonuclease subunit S [Clostridia bacterium]
MSMEYKRIDELTTVVTGGTPSTAVSEYWENGSIPWLQSGCCQNCDVNSTEKYITQLGLDNSSARMMPIDTVMIALTGATAGKIGYLNFEACGNQSITGIFPCEELNQRFLYYYLISLRPKILSDCVGGAQAHISQGYVKNIRVPVFSLEKQSKIAECLNKAQSIIDYRQKQLQSLDELIKARFVEMFGDPSINPKNYPVMSMSDIAEYWNGLTYRPEDVAEEGTVVLRSSNIQNMQLDFADTVRVNCKIGDKKYVQENDILMCSRNGSAKLVGKVALIQNLNEPMSFGAFMMIIRSEYYPYLMTYFQLPAFRSQITTGATTTINQITGNMMNKVMLPVPDKETMEQFAAFVSQIDKSKFIYLGGIYYDNRYFERNDSSCRWQRAG